MRSLLTVVGSTLAIIGYYIGIRREVTLDNLRRCFPKTPQRELKKIAYKSYKNLGRVFAEMIYLRFARLESIKKNTIVTNPEVFKQTLSNSNGLIVVAGHFANWEWLALGGSLRLETRFSVVRKNIQTSFTEQFLEKMRTRSGNRLVNSANTFTMIRILKEKGCIAILADQSAPAESTQVTFLNTQISALEGPARLALATGAELLFAECQLTDTQQYSITFHQINRSAEDTIHSLTQAHTTVLEQIIYDGPEFWLWQHKRWKNIRH